MTHRFHLNDLFDIVAAAIPDRVAVKDLHGPLSYADLQARIEKLAAILQAQGVGRGDTVGLYMRNSRAYVEGYMAATALGAVPFNVNFRYQPAELVYLFDNAAAKAVIYDADFAAAVTDLQNSCPALSVAIANDATYEARLAEAPALQTVERREDDIMLLYTGGTTGMPKGVMWPHKAFFFACLGGGGLYLQAAPIETPAQQAQYAIDGPQLKIFPLAPLMHGAASWSVFSALLGGLTVILDPLVDGFDADYIWQRVADEQANTIQIVGDAMATPLLASLENKINELDLSSMVHIGSGGAVLSAAKKQRFSELLPNSFVTDGLGSSESGISGMAAPATKGGMMRLESNAVQKTVCFDNGVPRFGAVGELGFLARGGHIPVGYYNDPVKSAEVFMQIDGAHWSVTGDEAVLDEDGMITIFGRGSTCINTGGEKVYPEEVEEALRAHPGVHDAVVVGLEDAQWGQIVGALVSPVAGQGLPNTDELQAHCRATLAGYKVPRVLRGIDEVRRSPAGKQDYKWAAATLAALSD